MPVSLTEPGSYYLTKSFTGVANGISVLSSHVSIDLNGYTIEGSGSGFGLAIGKASAPVTSVSISRGILSGFSNTVKLYNAMGPENAALGAIGAGDLRYGAPWTNFNINQTP